LVFGPHLLRYLQVTEAGSVNELMWARLIFAMGAVVTAATVLMIVRGHLYWQRRDSRHAG